MNSLVRLEAVIDELLVATHSENDAIGNESRPFGLPEADLADWPVFVNEIEWLKSTRQEAIRRATQFLEKRDDASLEVWVAAIEVIVSESMVLIPPTLEVRLPISVQSLNMPTVLEFGIANPITGNLYVLRPSKLALRPLWNWKKISDVASAIYGLNPFSAVSVLLDVLDNITLFPKLDPDEKAAYIGLAAASLRLGRHVSSIEVLAVQKGCHVSVARGMPDELKCLQKTLSDLATSEKDLVTNNHPWSSLRKLSEKEQKDRKRIEDHSLTELPDRDPVDQETGVWECKDTIWFLKRMKARKPKQ